ncbi:kelch-like protein 10 [Phymastichus coffea]|uniref:kelch-like protein 10 n=1 Tax=Phymastichus coffea TaxID=108790 RepID=UPI00273C91AF|nr:kelch-like protein 10 [Phymastichus coffea]
MEEPEPKSAQRARKERAEAEGSSRRPRCVCGPSAGAPAAFHLVWSELRSRGQLCDGQLVSCDQREFPVHRVVLSAASPYFRALFTNELSPSTSRSRLDAPGHALGLVLDYVYTGSCRVTADNVQQLLPLADRLEVLGVVQLCCRFLLDQLRPDNCLGICKFARHYFCRDLEERGRKYVRRHFREILEESAELVELECDELEAILRDDELNARTEELVFEAVRAWTEWRPSERAAQLPRLLGCPRYGLMSSRFFRERVHGWSVERNPGCRDVLAPVSAYLKARHWKSGSVDRMTRPRVPHEILFAVGGWTSGSPVNFVETYDGRANRWFLCSHVDARPRAYHGMCALNGLIYVVGGYEARKERAIVRCFDPSTKQWTEKACMYQARCYVSVCATGGKIYALGGKGGLTRLSSCERYEPAANQWEMIAPMNWPRSDASCATLDGKVYVAGGYDGLFILRSAEVYDPATDQWTYLAPMRVPRAGVSLVAFRGCLYVVGGFDGRLRLSSGENYEPGQPDAWQPVPDMYVPRSNFASVVLDELIFVIGGYDGWLPISCVECYDAESNQWYVASSMNVCRSALGVCVIAGLDNARDYSYHKQTPAPRLVKQYRQKPRRVSATAVIAR